tara:strand:- start:321 stop:548 length:228 start_codon:yes stop_codon:yes gene_type:complete
MSLEDMVKNKNIPTPTKGPSGNIPLQSPQGAGVNQVPLSSRIIGGARTVQPSGSPRGRHTQSPVDVIKPDPFAGE